MEKQYVTCTRRMESLDYPDGSKRLDWRDIPKDHSDPNIRSYYPGEWAPHPVAVEVEKYVFIFPKVK